MSLDVVLDIFLDVSLDVSLNIVLIVYIHIYIYTYIYTYTCICDKKLRSYQFACSLVGPMSSFSTVHVHNMAADQPAGQPKPPGKASVTGGCGRSFLDPAAEVLAGRPAKMLGGR